MSQSLSVGENVYLEFVECDNVTGNKVTIGPGVWVKGKVQYKDEVQVHPKTRMESEPEQIE